MKKASQFPFSKNREKHLTEEKNFKSREQRSYDKPFQNEFFKDEIEFRKQMNKDNFIEYQGFTSNKI